MKLSRKFLRLAAASLVAVLPAARADVTVKYSDGTDATIVGSAITLTNLGGPGVLAQPSAIQQGIRTVLSLDIGTATTLSLNQLVDATTTTKFLSADNTTAIEAQTFSTLPVIIKTGGATLQYDAFRDMDYHGNNTFRYSPPALPVSRPNDLRAQNAFSGLVVVSQGTLQVSGYLNQWANYGAANPAGFTARMVGAGAVILQGSATLSFQGTSYNVVGVGPALGNTSLGDPSTPLRFRLNYVHNLYAGTQANFLAERDGTDVNTVLDVGKDADYIANVHIDGGVVGSVGRLDGAGRVYKTGAGSLTILNTSRLTGDVFIVGGDLVLADANNLALRLASSVNLMGSDGYQTALAQADAATDPAGSVEWRPGYLPGRSAPRLLITANQAIRNFQSLWAETATNMFVAGTGAGAVVEIAAGTSLRIFQDINRDGFFTGSINGGDGVFIKDGVGTLALLGQGSSVGEINIANGKIIANVQSLGFGRVVLGAAGTLSIVQNNAGTLRAQINGAAGSTLTVSPLDAIVSNVSAPSPTSVGNGQLGVIDIYNQQQDFYGQVVVKDGITLAFSYGKDDTFIRASNIVLSSGDSGRETTIRFNDTTQRVNNLSGDANTRIELGRGTITINQSANTTYAGKVTGVGNLFKSGNSTMTLAGLNSYYGATVLRAGTIATTSANGIINTAGLVLLNGTTFTANANQTVGALFGQAGSSVVLANGSTLTVGKTDGQITQLNNALTNFPGTTPDLHPAFFLQTNLGTSSVAGMSQANTVGFLRTALGEPVDFTPISGIGSTLIVKDTFGLTVGQTVTGTGISAATTIAAILAAPAAQAAQTATGATIPLASTSGFLVGMPVSGTGIPSGTTVASITSGVSITLSNATTVIATGVISGTAGVTLSTSLTGAASGAYTLAPVSTDAEVIAYRGVISGNGGLTKVGDQTLFLGAINTYTGVTTVNGGTLQIDYNALAGTSVINVGLEGNLSVNVASGTQTFGNVLAGTGSFTKVGAGTLILNTLTGRFSGAVNINEGTLRFNLGSLYVNTGGQTNIADAAIFEINAGTDVQWSGAIAGAGTLLKTGVGQLTISGRVSLAETFTGPGLLQVAAGAVHAFNLPTAPGTPDTYGNVDLALGTIYRDTVTSATAAQTVLNAVIPLSSTAGFVVGQVVSGVGIPAGSTIVSLTATTITIDQVTTVLTTGLVLGEETFGGNISGLGTFEKAGLGNLNLTSQLSLAGDVKVIAGTLTLQVDGALDNVKSISLEGTSTLSLPQIGGQPAAFEINNLTGAATSTINADAAALSFTAAAGSTLTYAGAIIGSPDIIFNEVRPVGSMATHGTLQLLRPAAAPNAINSITVESGTLVGTIAGFGGATLVVDAGALIGFNNESTTVAEIYAGVISGLGKIQKTGAGQIELTNGTSTVSGYEVLGGRLIVSDARANAVAPPPFVELISATIASGATLEIHLDGGLERSLGGQITGVSSTSQGTLAITNSTTTNSDVYLTAAPALAAISLGDHITLVQNGQSVLVGVNGTSGAQINFSTGGLVTVNQAINTSFVGSVVGASTQATFVGPGRASFTNPLFATQIGPSTLTVGNGTTAGNLEIDAGFTTASDLTLVAGSLAVNALPGVLPNSPPLVFNTSLVGAHGAVKFIKTGTGSLNANAGSTFSSIFASYEIEAGTLVVTPIGDQILNGRSIAFKGGNLAIQQGVADATLGTAGFTTTANTATINVVGAVSGPTGTLRITGSFAGGLDLSAGAKVVLGTTGTTPIAISGNVNVGGGTTLGGQAIIGTTLANANLTNAGTISPGYSPGIVLVNGNVTNTGTFIMELSDTLANGTYNDQVLFTGTADLNSGNTGAIVLKQYDVNPLLPVAPAFGRRFVLFKDTLAPDANSFTSLIPALQISAEGVNPFRYLLSIPGTLTKTGAVGTMGSQVLSLTNSTGLVVGQAVTGTNIPANASISAINTVTNEITLNTPLTQALAGSIQVSLGSAGLPEVAGEVAVYVVRAPAAYDAFKAPASLLAAIKSITLVNSVKLTDGADNVAGTADDVYRSTPASSFNKVGGGLAILSDTSLQIALDNLTPYGSAGTATAALSLFRKNIDNAARRLELRRFDRSSLTILSNEWFVDTLNGQTTVGAAGEMQNNATVMGLTGGYTSQVGVDGVAGVALTAQRFSLTSDAATQASGNGFAANAFIGTVALRGQLSLDAGVTVSQMSAEITRDSVIGTGHRNTASPSAFTYGFWGRLGTVITAQAANTYYTPFISAEYSATKLSQLNETGQADAMSISDTTVSQAAVRLGVGLHHTWEEGRGDWRYRLSADVGYIQQLSGEQADFTSVNKGGINTTYTSTLRVNTGSGFYVAPSLNFGPDENSTYSIGFTYEQGNGKSIGVNAGYRRRF